MRRIVLWLMMALLWVVVDAQAQTQRRSRREPTGKHKASSRFKVGDVAPDFELPRLDPFLKAAPGKAPAKVETLKLSDLRNTRPVVIAFSSYT